MGALNEQMATRLPAGFVIPEELTRMLTWIDVTPEQAAADPARRDATRRDDLIRLIDSFPAIDPATGAFGLRPVALRARLGLSPG